MIPERPLCVVLMPFGMNRDPASTLHVDFDDIYGQSVRPAIEAAGMEPLRFGDEHIGHTTHEQLLLSEFVVADLTMAGPAVYYELGIRDAARPFRTLALLADCRQPPVDVHSLTPLPYRFAEGNRFGPGEAAELATNLTRRLLDLKSGAREHRGADIPLLQLLSDYRVPEVAHLKTDVFRDRVAYSASLKADLARARAKGGIDAAAAIEAGLGNFENIEIGVLVDLYLTWRALSQWDRMIGLYKRLPYALQRAVMIREQLGFALNRMGRREEALDVLEHVLKQQGASSETLSLIGRVYKDQWIEVRRYGDRLRAEVYLKKAIEAYSAGFTVDCRDAHPGINAVTLLDIHGSPESLLRKSELLPVVRFAVQQRLDGTKPFYWEWAALLELAVLDEDKDEAFRCLSNVLANIRENWEPASTANNLKLIGEAREARGAGLQWLEEIIAELESRSSAGSG
jgi:tetratricopeptide (TPR) repeat protein